jgi:hypothetical protein
VPYPPCCSHSPQATADGLPVKDMALVLVIAVWPVEAGPYLFKWQAQRAGYVVPAHALVTGETNGGRQLAFDPVCLLMPVLEEGFPVLDEPAAAK